MMTSAEKAPGITTRDVKRLNTLNCIACGRGDSANNRAFSLAMSFLALYLTDIGQLSARTVGLVFPLMRAVDAMTDVLMSSLVDRSSTRFGKFRPWIMFGSIPLMVLAILNFATPASIQGTAASSARRPLLSAGRSGCGSSTVRLRRAGRVPVRADADRYQCLHRSAAAMLIGVIVMHFYPMSDQKHREIIEELEARGGDSTAEAAAAADEA